MIEEQTGLLVYGYLPEKKELQVESRYLGLRLPGEMETMKETLKRLGSQAEETIDLAGLLSLAETAGMMEEEERRTSEGCGETDGKVPAKEKVRIGIAKDEAFCFFYQENLKILEDMGAELVYFSPLRDEKIPADVDGLIFYGGYPELYAEKLSRNSSMRDSVRMALKKGLPCIGECGGFLYLQEYLKTKEGKRFPMTGVLPGGSHYTGRLLRFGYVTLSGGTAFGRDAGEIPAHEFHYYPRMQEMRIWQASHCPKEAGDVSSAPGVCGRVIRTFTMEETGSLQKTFWMHAGTGGRSFESGNRFGTGHPADQTTG